MLRSTSKKFIFVHIPKTAGSSVKDSLIPYSDNKLFKYVATPFRKIGCPINFGPEPLEAHATAQDILNLLGNEFYDYYKFAFVRHPYQYIASTYSFIKAYPRHARHSIVRKYKCFDEFVDVDIQGGFHRTQSEFVYSKDNFLLVNFIGKFENLSADHAHICNHLKIPVSLPYINKSSLPACSIPLSLNSKNILQCFYEKDFINFSYLP